MDEHIKLGLLGEMEAANFLRDAGYVIVQANYRCKAGEIDIIAYSEKTYVFVEVKTRTEGAFFNPAVAVDRDKEENIKSSAANFISRYKINNQFRFDIVEVVKKNDKFECNHIKNAF